MIGDGWVSLRSTQPSWLSHALNSADGTFFGQIVAAETAALSAAFGLRADYERTIVQADDDYALALASSSDGPLAALADALGQHKLAAIDQLVAVESPRFASLEHWPFTIDGELQDVFLDRYTLNIDGLLDAIAAWDAAGCHCRPERQRR